MANAARSQSARTSGFPMPSKIEDVREPQDAPDHLAGTESQHILEQRVHESSARRFERGGIRGQAEHGVRKRIAGRVLGPEREEANPERSPEHLHLVENPPALRGPIVAGGLVAELGVPAEQKISEKRAEVEADRPVKRELRIDHAGIAVGDHHRAGMQVAVNERLGFGEKLLAEARGADLERRRLAAARAAASSSCGDVWRFRSAVK